jgi:prepilin-type N-terminal cleavage/methylation domain-containing protein
MFALVRRQHGLTLLELIMGIAISSVVLLAIAVALSQMFIMNGNVKNHTSAIRQVQNAGYWICRDAFGAQTILEDNDPGTSGFINLVWTDWAGIEYQSNYYFDGDDLHREHLVEGAWDSDIVIAGDIDPGLTSFEKEGAVYTLTISATVGNFPGPVTEVRTYEILPRSPQI